ncbi:MAG: biotin--[acetyl-CoA-carboxylase] ligase [Candidatus Pelagibacter sp.]|nr:biotin--[acetyl-CoA-carboxylase] ligase [Candidatus Pelagibacter sp.]|tara:strand:- start:21 stop:539 length:519 start_codon:yes stop_codon:yes gene_type:complete
MKLKKFLFKKINSTNDKSIELIKKGYRKGIVVTDNQTNGRGRYGRKWISLKGNLFMSVFYLYEKKLNLIKLTKFNYKVITDALKKLTKIKITIKHPNDLLINKKKLCGILQEIIKYKGNTFIIVGIGVNVINSPQIKNYRSTYLNKYLKKNINKNHIFNVIKKFYEKNLGKL